MSRPTARIVLVVGLIALTGCSGFWSSPALTPVPSSSVQVTPSPTAQAASITPSVGVRDHRNISIVNRRSTTYTVTFRVFRGPMTAVNLTFRNGSVRTVLAGTFHLDLPPPEKLDVYLSRFDGDLTNIEPVHTSQVARWSAVIRPHSTASLPIPVERRNVTYVVVFRPRTSGNHAISKIDIVWCRPAWTLERYQLELLQADIGPREHGSGTGDRTARGYVSCG